MSRPQTNRLLRVPNFTTVAGNQPLCEVTSAWDPESVGAGDETLTTSSAFNTTWDIDPMDYDRAPDSYGSMFGHSWRNGWVIQPRTTA
jgi:hypothetical protein